MHREDSVTENLGLEVWLETAVSGRPDLRPVSMAILALAEAGRKISKILARGLLEGALSEIIGDSRDGDGQKALDAMTHDIIRTALAATPVAALASEEADAPELLDPRGAIAGAIDPLDGSSNIDANVGRMLDTLDSLKLTRETIVIFMTDNGGTAGVKTFNAGLRAGKTTYYDGGHRVRV